MQVKNLAIVLVFGGRSVEHDVSILTGLHAARHVLEGTRVYLVYMDRDNRFWLAKNLDRLSHRRWCWARMRDKVDVVLNCCHGGVGEAGELAALLKVYGIPFTSSEPESASKMMSKSTTRSVIDGSSLPTISWKSMRDIPQDIVGISDILPQIVKPDLLGSSIGVSVIRDVAQFEPAVQLAMSFGRMVVVERFLEGAVEVNCAAFRCGSEVLTSECEEVSSMSDKLLTFNDKYLGPAPQFKGKSGKVNTHPLSDKIKELTRKAYELFGASGIVRCDFLIHEGEIYLNEINSVPGFLSYHLFLRAGIPYGMLIDMVCRQAISDFRAKQDFVTEFSSSILEINRSLVDN